MSDTPAMKMELQEQVIINVRYLVFKDSYGTEFRVPIRSGLITPRGMTVLAEALEKIEQMTEETL